MRRRPERSRRWGRRAVAAFVAIAGLGAEAGAFENPSLAKAFGGGMHAYFSGAYDRTYDDMTAVIEADSDPRDPRPLYFRGLAALKMGRLDEAEADFSAGAELEALSPRAVPVSPSLERVQGCDRLRLEQHRVRARVAFQQRDRQDRQKRYSGLEDAQADVLRERRPTDRTEDSANPFDAAPAPRPRPAPAPEPEPMPEPEPEPMPEVPAEQPAAGGDLEPEPDPPADPGEPAAEAPGEVMETEEPAAEPEPSAEPAEPAAEPEPPAAPVEPEVPAEPAPATAEPEMPEEPAAPVEPADGPGAEGGDVPADGAPAEPAAEPMPADENAAGQ